MPPERAAMVRIGHVDLFATTPDWVPRLHHVAPTRWSEDGWKHFSAAPARVRGLGSFPVRAFAVVGG